MGKAIQGKDYVIVFDASPETLEDVLNFFDCDIEEARLGEPGPHPAFESAVGVHVDSLNEDLSFTEYFGIQNEKLFSFSSEEPLSPAIVHFLHFRKINEIKTHHCLSGKFSKLKIRMVNPYNSGTSNCDSKFRMFRVFKDSGIPTPDARLISRFNKQKADSIKRIAEEFSGAGLYIQPDRGTEGESCFFLECGDYRKAAPILDQEDEDFIIRRKTGNILYKGKNFVLRINVCFDGDEFYANSGYCMVGGKVVSAGMGARRVNINKLISYLNPGNDAVSRIKQTACDAVRAVFQDVEPSLLVGVDLVLEKQGGYSPYVIDINPRPVVVGSKIIGTNRIGLGEHYWQGISKLTENEKNGNKAYNFRKKCRG